MDSGPRPGPPPAAGPQSGVGAAGALFIEGGYRLAGDPARRPVLLRGEVLAFGYRVSL